MQRSAIMRCIFISERRITWYLLFYAYFAEITVKLAVLLTLQRIYRLCFLDMVVLSGVPCLYPLHIALSIR